MRYPLINTSPKYIRGGIGDVLQCIEGAIEAKEVSLFSHYEKAPDLLTPFGVNVTRFEYFQTYEELHDFYMPGEHVERKFFPAFTMPKAPIPAPKKYVLGIHIEGSEYSNKVWSARNRPTKNMSKAFLEKLIENINGKYKNICLYVFCAPARQSEISVMFSELCDLDFVVISFKNIWDSLSCVSHCKAVLAMDSCIKSMSAILRIPSVVLVGDYPDPFRNEQFLNPYVNEGVMELVPYTDIDLLDSAFLLDFLPYEYTCNLSTLR